MKTALSYLLSLIAIVVVFVAPTRGEITTVILSEPHVEEFKITANKEPSPTLYFDTETTLPEDAVVTRCELRVVAKKWADENIGGQSVQVRSADGTQTGRWDAHDSDAHDWDVDADNNKFKAYGSLLENPEKECARKKSVGLTLRGVSLSPSEWRYYGGKAEKSSMQPRLMITYKSLSRETLAVSGERTSWTYSSPAGFFASPLLLDGKRLTNPVTYNGAVFAVVQPPEGGIYVQRAPTPGAPRSPKLDNTIDGPSFALTTVWGQMYVVTNDLILRQDLARLNDQNTAAKLSIAIAKSDEPPALGPDGSTYFRNTKADGRIVAYNPGFREIWESERVTEAVSPIVLSPDGRFAFALYKYNDGELRRAVVRFDTATGATVEHLIEYASKTNKDAAIAPPIDQLYRPAVVRVTEKNGDLFDYVFVAGNTNDEGILQLVRFKANVKQSEEVDHSTLWNQTGKKIWSAPLVSRDSNSVYLVQDSALKRYPRVQQQGTADFDSNLDDYDPKEKGPAMLVIDGGGSIYVHAGGTAYAYDEKLSLKGTTKVSTLKGMFFTSDGALVGYDDAKVYDLSPKASAVLSPPVLAGGTIYSAETVSVPANPGVKNDEQVILKGNKITFPNDFRWPVGTTLRVQSVQQ